MPYKDKKTSNLPKWAKIEQQQNIGSHESHLDKDWTRNETLRTRQESVTEHNKKDYVVKRHRRKRNQSTLVDLGHPLAQSLDGLAKAGKYRDHKRI